MFYQVASPAILQTDWSGEAIQIKFSRRKRSFILNQWLLHPFPWELSCPCEDGSWGDIPCRIFLPAEGTGDIKCPFWTLRWIKPIYNRPVLCSNSTKQQLLAWLTFGRAAGGWRGRTTWKALHKIRERWMQAKWRPVCQLGEKWNRWHLTLGGGARRVQRCIGFCFHQEVSFNQVPNVNITNIN